MSVQRPVSHNATPSTDPSQQLAAFLKTNMRPLILAACCVLAGFVLVTFIRQGRDHDKASAWARFSKATSAADFGDVASDPKLSSSEVAIWARLTEADRARTEGMRLQFSNRKGADLEFKRANEAFDTVLKTANVAAAVSERATIGKARFLEATSDGSLEPAIVAYEAFQTKFPDSYLKESVAERIAALKKPDAKEFYAWFSKQSPSPEDRRRPQDGLLPTGHPDIPLTLPPIPDELYPANWSELKADLEDSKPAASGNPAAEKPAAEPTPAANEKPAAPAEKNPDEAKPVDAKPADNNAADPAK